MTLLENNLKAVKARWERHYTILFNHKEVDERFYVEYNKDNKAYQVFDDGKIKRILNSKYNPVKEAEDWCEQMCDERSKLMILYGLGVGYRIDQLYSRLKDDELLFIVEPSLSNCISIFSHYDASILLSDPRVFLWVGEINVEFSQYTDVLIKKHNHNKMKIIDVPLYLEIFHEEYKRMMVHIRNRMLAICQNVNTRKKYMIDWQTNLLLNVTHLAESLEIARIKDVFKGQTGIIVASGPSLTKNVSVLKNVGDDALIIALSSSLRVLEQHGIKPHFVITMHGDHEVLPTFEGVDFDNVTLVYTMESYYKVQDIHRGNKVVIQSMTTPMSELYQRLGMKEGSLKTGYSVAHTAFNFAMEIGVEKVIMVGQDLAFSGKDVHAEGVIASESIRRYDVSDMDTNDMIAVEGYYGGEVTTNRVFFSYIKWFETYISHFNEQIKVINATEGGALIRGAENLSLNEAVSKYCNMSVEPIEKLFSEIHDNRSSRYEQIAEYMTVLQVEIEELRETALEGLRYSKEMRGIYERDAYVFESEKIRMLIEELDEIDRHLMGMQEKTEFIESLMVALSEEIVNTDFDLSDEKEKGLIVTQRGIELYDRISESAAFALPRIEECLNRLSEKQDI